MVVSLFATRYYTSILLNVYVTVSITWISKVTWGNFGNGVTSGILSSDDYNSSLLPAIQ